MFYGYPISQWIDVGVYMLFMIILFIGVFAVSCMLSNKFLHKDKIKNKFKNKKTENKSYFTDVA